MGLGVVGLEPDRLAVGGDGLVELPLVAQGVAEVLVGLGVVGLEPDRLAELRRSASSSFPWLSQGESPRLIVGLGVVGLEPDRLAEFGDGLVELPLVPRAMPRLMWAQASSGLSRIASRPCGDGGFERLAGFLATAPCPSASAQAAEVPAVAGAAAS